MMKLYNILKKNIRLVFKSKFTLVLAIVTPLIALMLIGLVFQSTGSLRINIGYYSPSDSDTVDSLTHLLKEQNYSVTEYRSVEGCLRGLKTNKEQICVEFPEKIDFKKGHVNEVKFHGDNSKMSLYQPVIDTIDGLFTRRAHEISDHYTQDILDRLDYIKEEAHSAQPVLQNLSGDIEKIESDILGIADKLQGMDISIGNREINTGNVKNDVEDIRDSSSSLTDLGEVAVNEIMALDNDISDNLNDAEDLLEDNNLSDDDIVSARKKVNDFVESAENLRDEIRHTENKLLDSVENTQHFIDTVERFNNLHEKDKDKLRELSNTRDQIVAELEEVADNISQTTLHLNKLKTSITEIEEQAGGTLVKDSDSIVKPFKKTTVPLKSQENHVMFIFPYVLLLVIMFMGLLLSSLLVMDEKRSNAIFRNFVTPTNNLVFIIGNFLTVLVIIALQLVFLLGVFASYFQKDIFTNLGVSSLIIFALISFFTMLGTAIAYLMDNEQTSMFVAILVGTVFLFLSDLVSPLQKLPMKVDILINKFNVFVLGTGLLRKSMIYHIPLAEIKSSLVLIMLYAIILFCLAFLIVFIKKQQLTLFRKRKKKKY